jgi:tetratricopeptide (TPR) repeat protein
MGNDFRRDHSFRIPRPDQSVKYETPNACNGCHKDKSAEWSSDFIVEKYGPDRADHFSDHLLKGYFEDPNAWKILFSNKNYPGIARATALSQYANQPLSLEEIQALTAYLKDPSVMVRNEAIRALELQQSQNFSDKIMPLLKDSVRVVRISAASYFNSIGNLLPENDSFSKANAEYLINLDTNSDFPQGLNQIAVYHQNKGNTELAIANYKKAIIEDNRSNRSRMNLALIYYEQGRIKECEALYLKVAEQEPEFSYSFYMLGLLYNELGQNDKALEYLKLATEKVPVNSNAFYNYIVLLQQQGKNEESLKVAKKALELNPNNDRILYVQMTGQMNLKKVQDAYKTCLLLVQLDPNNTNYQQILAQLSQELNNK